jgi:hypothetical protein
LFKCSDFQSQYLSAISFASNPFQHPLSPAESISGHDAHDDLDTPKALVEVHSAEDLKKDKSDEEDSTEREARRRRELKRAIAQHKGSETGKANKRKRLF